MTNETIPPYKRTFFQICERALYYEYDRQSQLQARITGLTTLVTLLCAAAWYFSSFAYLHRSPCILYIYAFASAWSSLFCCIYFIAYAAVYRSQSALADMSHWQKWLRDIEQHYEHDGTRIECEMLDKLSTAMSETQTRYAVSNERRYKSMQKAQMLLIAAMLCVALLACVKYYLDYTADNRAVSAHNAPPKTCNIADFTDQRHC